jgi:hypothetical protein
MSVDISIVVPAYNPQERIFRRVLEAIASLDGIDSPGVECVVVDNNSSPPLCEVGYVREFLTACAGARLVREERQGLAFARLAGFSATSGSVVVVLDDDNVPEKSYLRVVATCVEAFPWVGVWGPGTIDVEFLDAVPVSLQQRARATHSERRERFVQYGCIPASWQPFYPIGMGQVIRREVVDAYARAAKRGELTATGRRGGSLASGEDIQIVWQAIKMGLSAGVHPELAMTHLIPGNRTTVSYLKRLAFGCGMSYHPALAQSFPPQQHGPSTPPPAWRDAVNLAAFLLRRMVRGRVRFLSIDFANLLGLMCGRVVVEGRGQSYWTFRLARTLGLT